MIPNPVREETTAGIPLSATDYKAGSMTFGYSPFPMETMTSPSVPSRTNALIAAGSIPGLVFTMSTRGSTGYFFLYYLRFGLNLSEA